MYSLSASARGSARNFSSQLCDCACDTTLKGALVVYPNAPPNEFQILSDDGTRKLAGEDCKKIKDPLHKWFRSYWVRLE